MNEEPSEGHMPTWELLSILNKGPYTNNPIDTAVMRVASERIRELYDLVFKMREQLTRIKEHWEDGVSEDTERENSWHGTMRDILDET